MPKTMPKALRLTDAQLILLSRAAKRDDHLVEVDADTKAGALKKVAASLLKRGFLKEAKAKRGQPVCWTDGDARIGLRITDVGLRAIGIEPEAGITSANAKHGDAAAAETKARAQAVGSPRPGSKQALLVELMSRSGGATLDELIGATGWLPHTTRAALTGLRRRGFAIERTARKEGQSAYLIAAAEPEPAPVEKPRAARRRRKNVEASAPASA